MKDNTKKLIVLGGLGAVGIYFLTRDSDDAVGGFGGGGGIPLLPGDTEGAAEGDTVINYILGGDAEDPFNVFGDGEGADTKKGMALLEKYERIIESTKTPPIMTQMLQETAAAGLKPTTGGEWAAQQRELAEEGVTTESKKADEIARLTDIAEAERTQIPVATGDVGEWNWQDAANNVGLWLLGAPQPPTPGEAAAAAGAIDLWSEESKSSVAQIGAQSVEATTIVKKVKADPGFTVKSSSYAAKYRDTSLSSAERGYSTMASSTRHSPGWKQIGAKKPTAPGQPDRY